MVSSLIGVAAGIRRVCKVNNDVIEASRDDCSSTGDDTRGDGEGVVCSSVGVSVGTCIVDSILAE